MKRNLRTLALLVFSFMGIGLSSALQQNSFKVYKSDGSVDVIFFEKLDSITYTKIDLDGNLHDEIKTQEIHTADSLYRYAINEIDSVSFQPLPTIYKNGIVKVEGTLRDYVIGSESLNLFLRLDCPEYLMPKRGENVVTLECDETLPSGFIGKVESIEHGDNKIIIVCTQASLTDIFESLELTVSATSEPEETPTRAFGDLIWPPRHFNLTLPSIKGSIALSDVKKAGDLSGEYNMTSSLELNTEKFEVNVALMIRPRPIVPEVYFSYTSTGSHNLSLGSSLSSSLKYEHEFPIEKFRNIRIPGVPVIELFEEGGLFVSLEGSFGLDGTYTKPFKTITHFTFDNTKPVSIPPMLKVMGEDSEIETKLEGEVKAALGLYLKFGVGALVKEAANVDVDFKVGPEFSSTVDLATSEASVNVRNTDMYDMLNRDDFYRVDLMASASVEASILNDTKLSGTVSFGDLLFKNPIFTRGVVPEFNDLEIKNSTTNSLVATAKVDRNLMSRTKIGFGIYDTDNRIIKQWWHDNNYKQPGDIEIFEHKFTDLEADKDYYIHPLTSMGALSMPCSPSIIARTAGSMCEVYKIQDSGRDDLNGIYRFDFKIEKGDTIIIIKNYHANGLKTSSWDAYIGEFDISSFQNTSLTNENNYIDLYYDFGDPSSFSTFDESDYENWIGKIYNQTKIYYLSSVDNYKSTREMDVPFNIVYDRKPEYLGWYGNGNEPLADYVIVGAVHLNYNGIYWLNTSDLSIYGDYDIFTTDQPVYVVRHSNGRENGYVRVILYSAREPRHCSCTLTLDWPNASKETKVISYDIVSDGRSSYPSNISVSDM